MASQRRAHDHEVRPRNHGLATMVEPRRPDREHHRTHHILHRRYRIHHKNTRPSDEQEGFRTLVRTTDRDTIGRQPGKDIQAGALEQLHYHARRAADFADRHVNLLRSRPSQSSFITQTLTSLRDHVTHLGPPACNQLQEVMSTSTSPLLAGAASTAIYAIDRFRSLFEVLPDNEPDPNALIGSALLHFPAIPVDRAGLPDGDLRQALDTLVSNPPETLRTSFNLRLNMETSLRPPDYRLDRDQRRR